MNLNSRHFKPQDPAGKSDGSQQNKILSLAETKNTQTEFIEFTDDKYSCKYTNIYVYVTSA